MNRIQIWLASASLWSLAAFGQTRIAGPVEGFVFDAPTGALRAVNGLLGSATLGPPFLNGLDAAFVAPGKNHALAIRDQQLWLVTGLGTDNVALASVAADNLPAQVAWSGDGSAAVLYSRSTSSIQLVSGLPSAPSVQTSIDITSLTSSTRGSLVMVAADTTGQNIAIGIDGNQGSVYMRDINGNFTPVAPATKPVALGFSGDGQTLFAIDYDNKKLIQVQLADLTSQSVDVSDLTDPIAVAAVRDGQGRSLVYVAAGADSMVRSYDALTHEIIATVALEFQPTSIQTLGKATYIVAPRVNRTDLLWTLRGLAVPVPYFVPADIPDATQGATQK
jgi:hypothetical protein